MTATENDLERCINPQYREELAKRIADLCRRKGVLCYVAESMLSKTSTIGALDVVIGLGPVRAFITIRANAAEVGAFVVHWAMDSKSGIEFPVDFGETVRGSVNGHHFQKATTVAYTEGGLLEAIEAGLVRLKTDPRMIAAKAADEAALAAADVKP